MKPRMCIFYYGIGEEHWKDESGDGGCLNAHDSKGNCLPRREVIAAGNCHKKLKSPRLFE